jgi:hypothetical protein
LWAGEFILEATKASPTSTDSVSWNNLASNMKGPIEALKSASDMLLRARRQSVASKMSRDAFSGDVELEMLESRVL